MLLDPEMLDEVGVGVVVRDADGVVLTGNAAAVALVPAARPGSVLDRWPAGVVTAHRTIGGPDLTVVLTLVAPVPLPAEGQEVAGPSSRAETPADRVASSPHGDASPHDDAAPAEAVPVVPVVSATEPGGLLDRWALADALRRDAERARRSGEPLTVVALGVEDTAAIAEAWGAAALADALAGVGQVLAGALRGSDSAASVDDERFLVLLPGAATGDAVSLVARLQEVCRSWVSTPDGRPVTFGAGVATVTAADEPEDVVRRADAALDRALGGGRDRIEVA